VKTPKHGMLEMFQAKNALEALRRAASALNRAFGYAYADAGSGPVAIFPFCPQGIFYTSGPNACSLFLGFCRKLANRVGEASY
jgi:hypothetical protein